MAYETITLDVENHVAIVTLNRPDALNALNDQLMSELADALKGCQENDKVRVDEQDPQRLVVSVTRICLGRIPIFSEWRMTALLSSRRASFLNQSTSFLAMVSPLPGTNKRGGLLLSSTSTMPRNFPVATIRCSTPR